MEHKRMPYGDPRKQNEPEKVYVLPEHTYTYSELKPYKEKQIVTVQAFLGVTGLCLAIYLAHKHDQKFWGYAGYIFLAGMISGGLSWGIGMLMVDANKDVIEKTEVIQPATHIHL